MSKSPALERVIARDWWKGLSPHDRALLGDALVLGEFDWRDWGFESKPSSAFMNEVDRQRVLWEQSYPEWFNE